MPKDIDNNDYVAQHLSKKDKEYIADLIREELSERGILYDVTSFNWELTYTVNYEAKE